MEIYNMILEAISTIGFPIVVACALFWKMHNMDKMHNEEMKAVTEALQNNTIAITQLTETVEDLKEERSKS